MLAQGPSVAACHKPRTIPVLMTEYEPRNIQLQQCHYCLVIIAAASLLIVALPCAAVIIAPWPVSLHDATI
jgi:hypothetical protein